MLARAPRSPSFTTRQQSRDESDPEVRRLGKAIGQPLPTPEMSTLPHDRLAHGGRLVEILPKQGETPLPDERRPDMLTPGRK
jgi:hypothetical protein